MVDDLHGADQPSLLLLEFLAGRLNGKRLLVVAAYRNTAVGDGHPLRKTLADLAAMVNSESIELLGLSEAEVGRLLTLQAGRVVSPSIAGRLHARTEGNPFFAGEFIRALAAEGNLEAANEIEVPATVRSVIGRRLGRLTQPCREALRVAAVIGREFSNEMVVRVSGIEEEAVDRALAEAADALIVTEAPGGRRLAVRARAGERDAVRGGRSRGSVRSCTGESARQWRGMSDAEEHLAELAYHFGAADGAAEARKAVDYARRAGERALELLAYEEAARLFAAGVAALEHSGDAGCRDTCRVAPVAREMRANARATSKRPCRCFCAAADVARQLGSPGQLTRAALGFAPNPFYPDAPQPNDRQVELLEEAIAAWGDVDSALHALALARLALGLFFTDAEPRRRELYGRAVEMARRVGDPQAIAFALNVQHLIGRVPDDLYHRIEVLAEISTLAERTADREMEVRARLWRCGDLMELGDIDGFHRAVDALGELAAELRQPLWQWYTQHAEGQPSHAVWRLGGRRAIHRRSPGARRSAVDVRSRAPSHRAALGDRFSARR